VGKNAYVERIKKLTKLIGKGRILLLGNELAPKNYKDNTYPFRQDSCFLYFTGISRPGLSLLIDVDEGNTILYGDEATTDDLIWIGASESLVSLAEKSGIKKVKPKRQLRDDVSSEIHHLPPYRAQHKLALSELTGNPSSKPSQALIDAIIKLRSYKAVDEISEMSKAVDISNQVHETVIRGTRPNSYEYELVAKGAKVAFASDATWAYIPILTKDGQTLHNHFHGNQLSEGDMVLFDGGVELASGYCADLTRTFPVGNKFSNLQKEIYSIVHQTYENAASLSKPGITYKDVHLQAAKTIAEGLVDIGWMNGDPEEIVADGAHTLFFPHGLGHMIGLDVHDMENLGEIYVGYENPEDKSTAFGLKSLRLGRALEERFCITIEPGIYLIPELIDKYQAEGLYKDHINYSEINKHRNFGGIRLEDDFVITDTGAQRIGSGLGTKAEEMEALRASV